MNCSYCKEKAVVLKGARGLCKKHFVSCFHRVFLRTIKRYKLISSKDNLAIGLSGGKDSCSLLFATKRLLKNPVFAILIDVGIKGYGEANVKNAEAICERLGVPLHVFSFKKEFGTTIDELVKNKKRPCSYCGVLRRWILNKKAGELGATKLLTGHNMDDEAQAVLMSMFLANVPAFVRLGFSTGRPQKGFVPRIKPFRLISEYETALYYVHIVKGLTSVMRDCPYAKTSFRKLIQEELNKLETRSIPPVLTSGKGKVECWGAQRPHRIIPSTSTRHHFQRVVFDREKPGAKENIIRKHGLVKERIKTRGMGVFACVACGQPTSKSMCSACRMLVREVKGAK